MPSGLFVESISSESEEELEQADIINIKLNNKAASANNLVFFFKIVRTSWITILNKGNKKTTPKSSNYK